MSRRLKAMDKGDSTAGSAGPGASQAGLSVPAASAAISDETQAEPEEPSQSTSFLSRIGKWAFGSPTAEAAEDDDPRAALEPLLALSRPAERRMFVNIFRMRELRVEDVMTPRADITAVSVDDPLDAVVAAFRSGYLSRLPVYRETLDDPIGFVHLKDIALNYGFGCEADEAFKLADHIRTALFVPASMRAAALLQQMQLKRIHMALVIDEFGGVDGLVTIEDLVEQIVGDIEDEHDEAELLPWREESPGVFVADARAEIAAFEEAVGATLKTEDWEEDVDTLGGLVFMLANRVPTRGEVIAHPNGHEFEVTDADPRRIKRVRIMLAGSADLQQREAAE